MVERIRQTDLDAVLKATSDTTRRSILSLLTQEGPLRITDIHARYTISLNAISKHIKVLEAAGLVTRRTEWREHLIEVNMAPLKSVDDWISELRSIWTLRLEALDDIPTKRAAKK